MHVVITGGAGFLGLRLARTILAAGTIAVAGQPPLPVRQLTLLDRVAPPAADRVDPRVRVVTGDLHELLCDPLRDSRRDPLHGPSDPGPIAGGDVVFHLAAAVSGACEADFDLGIQANLRAGYALLQACRALPSPPCLVFASSVAVYGQWPDLPAPATITDVTLPTPRSSYGAQKFILEQLIADYTRKGFVTGRPVRLMTVCVRPGAPNAAASSFLSSIIREPLAGQPAVCPVPASTAVVLSSPERTTEGLLRAAGAGPADWGAPVAVNLPGVETTVAEMVAALAEVAGPAATALIDWRPDPAIAQIVSGWPARFETTRAHGLGLTADPGIGAIVRAYAREAAEESH